MPFDSTYKQDPDGLGSKAKAYGPSRRGSSPKDAEGIEDPRLVTRGSFSRKRRKTNRNFDADERMSAFLDRFAFDWYQITLPALDGGGMMLDHGDEQRAIMGIMEWADSMSLHPGPSGGGANAYRASVVLHDGPEGEPIGKILSGSVAGVMPNLTLTGGDGLCARLAPQAQAQFTGGRLCRADVCFDWSQEGLYEALLAMTKRLASGNTKLGGVQTIESETGRTFYLGSPQSKVRLRVYEKDKERVAKKRIRAEECDPDLVRVELQFRSDSRSAAGLASLTPAELLCTSVWVREWLVRMAAHLFEVDWRTKLPKTVVDREPRVTDLEASAQHGAKQFGGIFSRLAISRMVADRFDGSYADAVFTVEEVEAKAAMLFWEQLKDNQAAERAMDREGVRRPETVWMRRARIVSDMGRTASDNESKTTAARAALEAWVRPPGEVPPEVPAG